MWPRLKSKTYGQDCFDKVKAELVMDWAACTIKTRAATFFILNWAYIHLGHTQQEVRIKEMTSED